MTPSLNTLSPYTPLNTPPLSTHPLPIHPFSTQPSSTYPLSIQFTTHEQNLPSLSYHLTHPLSHSHLIPASTRGVLDKFDPNTLQSLQHTPLTFPHNKPSLSPFHTPSHLLSHPLSPIHTLFQPPPVVYSTNSIQTPYNLSSSATSTHDLSSPLPTYVILEM